MAREAEAMGLEQDDTIIRRRLAQKLKFLVEDTAQLARAKRGGAAAVLCRQLSALRDAGKALVPAGLLQPGASQGRRGGRRVPSLPGLKPKAEGVPTPGDRLLFGDSFDDTDELALSGMFGADFAHEVFALATGRMARPGEIRLRLPSGLVTQRTPTAPKPFESGQGCCSCRVAQRQDRPSSAATTWPNCARNMGWNWTTARKRRLVAEPAAKVAAK